MAWPFLSLSVDGWLDMALDAWLGHRSLTRFLDTRLSDSLAIISGLLFELCSNLVPLGQGHLAEAVRKECLNFYGQRIRPRGSQKATANYSISSVLQSVLKLLCYCFTSTNTVICIRKTQTITYYISALL